MDTVINYQSYLATTASLKLKYLRRTNITTQIENEYLINNKLKLYISSLICCNYNLVLFGIIKTFPFKISLKNNIKK